jgi:hypothetical protein
VSIDALAAIVAGDADLAALIDAELAQLASDAQALRGLLVENAVVTARVLPSNGLTDLLEIAGRRVAASLPPTVRPGDVLQVRVTGFDGVRILLQIVDTGADAAVETGPPGVPVAPPPSTFVAASIVPAPSAATAAPAGSPTPALAAPVVTAQVVGDAAAPAVAVPIADLPAAAPSGPPPGAGFSAAVSRANVAPQSSGDEPRPPSSGAAPARAPIVVGSEPTSIEARMAAARATVAAVSTASAGRAATIGETLRTVAAPTLVPAIPVRSAPGAAQSALGATPRASGLSAYTEPVALLRALRLPVTPATVAAATSALARPDRLPDALAALERALPNAADNPQVATLRALLSFVGRLDPRSPALASQVAAYVDHVVDGAEPKLATLFAATRAATPSEPATAPPPLPAAVAAERSAALSVDLKQTLLAVASDPATPAPLAPPLAAALTALTAVQLNAAQALAAHPDGIVLTLPLVTEHGAANARISIKRDAPQGRGEPVDAQNFRIAFVLDTIHYGTVAIDLVTVGREVTVDVRTEAAGSMRAFRDALGGLTARLESLRYRVASAGASVGTTSTIGVEAPPAQPLDPQLAVDRSA